MIRFFIPKFVSQAGHVMRLDKDQLHHIKVRRIAALEEIIIFNTENGNWKCIYDGKSTVQFVEQASPAQPTHDLWLVQSLIQKDRFSSIVEKATELGITDLIPLTTHYTQSKTLNIPRITQHLIEAAQQCERTDIPNLLPTTSFIDLLRSWPEDRLLYTAIERETTPYLGEIIQRDKKAAFLIGPEGGFSLEEKELLLVHKSVRAFTFGSRILRADTAAIAALSIYQDFLGH
jgi:16S rRNA (uracil1498-N3)-methyltransferase